MVFLMIAFAVIITRAAADDMQFLFLISWNKRSLYLFDSSHIKKLINRK